MKNKKTMREAVDELIDARDNFLREVGIFKLMDWLEDKLKKLGF